LMNHLVSCEVTIPAVGLRLMAQGERNRLGAKKSS
jgi:hypothetical protein